MPENAPYENAPGADRRPESSPARSLFRIGEVGRLTGTKPFVLRYWETEFPTLQPVKSPKGHRLYRREDVETVRQIKRLLYDEGFTIAGARRHLAETTGRTDAADESLRKPPAAVLAPIADRSPGLFPEDDVLGKKDRDDDAGEHLRGHAVREADLRKAGVPEADGGRETVVRSLNHNIRENDIRQNSINDNRGSLENRPDPYAANRDTRNVPDVRKIPDGLDEWDAAHADPAADDRSRATPAHQPKRAQQLSGGRLRADSASQAQIDRQALLDLRDALRSLLTLLESE